MSTPYPRDLIGYGGNPPHPHWPGEARIAVNFVMNYEEGSEYNVHDDGFSEATLTEAGGADSGVQGRDLAAEGLFEYGSRVGFWRVLRIFKERGLPMTVFGCALALERNPAVAAASARPASTSARTAGAGSSTGSSPRRRSASTSAWRSSR